MNPVTGFRMLRFLEWLSHSHPEVQSIKEESIFRLLTLVDEFEAGALGQNPDLSRKWIRGFRVLLATDRDWQGYGEARSFSKKLFWAARRRSEGRDRDQLQRYRNVPLHAIFLYSTEDSALASYITRNWCALDRLSANYCDIYPSLGQLADQEDAYSALGLLSDILGYVDLTDLPGMAFWGNGGKVAYIPFCGWSEDSITHGLRFIFDAIRTDPSIPAVLKSKKGVREFVSRRMGAESTGGPVFNQHVYGGTAGQAMNLVQTQDTSGTSPSDPSSARLGTIPPLPPHLSSPWGELEALQEELISHANQLPKESREAFYSDMDAFANSGRSREHLIGAGLRIAASLFSFGNAAALRAVIAKVESLVGPTIEP
ncbi:hypothetical protein [Streptomyces olivaceus]